MSDFSFFTNPPIRHDWLEGHPAYESDSAALVRAYVRLLKSAFRSSVPGAINASSVHIAAACGLSEAEVLQHWEILTHGWELREDGYLHHDRVSRLCVDLNAQYGAQLSDLRAQIASAEIAAQALLVGIPVAQVKPGRKPRAKRTMPEGFGLTPDLVEWLNKERGITHPYHHKFLMEGFIAYARAKAPTYADWDAAFKSNVDLALRSSRQLPTPPSDATPFGHGRRPNFGAPQIDRQRALRSSVEDVFDRAHGRDAVRGGLRG